MTTTTSTVTLEAAVKIDGEDVTDITLRKPQPGELRGLNLSDVLQMDTDTMMTLLPRITMPPLDGAQISGLDPADYTALCTKTVVFFTGKLGVPAPA